MTWSGALMVMTLEVLMRFDPREHGLLKPEEFDLFEIGPAGAVGERFHLVVGEGAADGEARVVAHHRVADDEGGEEPDAEGGEPAADEVDAGGADAARPAPFPAAR